MSQGHRLNSPVFFCMPSISIVKKKAAEVGKEASRSCPTQKSPTKIRRRGLILYVKQRLFFLVLLLCGFFLFVFFIQWFVDRFADSSLRNLAIFYTIRHAPLLYQLEKLESM